MNCPERYFRGIEITGTDVNTASPREIDFLLTDNEGIQYSMNVMTIGRYEDAQAEQPDIGYDADAAHVLVVDADVIPLDALTRQLMFEPEKFASFVQKIEPEDAQ